MINEYNKVLQLINRPCNTINYNSQVYIWTKVVVNMFHVYLITSESCIFEHDLDSYN